MASDDSLRALSLARPQLRGGDASMQHVGGDAHLPQAVARVEEVPVHVEGRRLERELHLELTHVRAAHRHVQALL